MQPAGLTSASSFRTSKAALKPLNAAGSSPALLNRASQRSMSFASSRRSIANSSIHSLLTPPGGGSGGGGGCKPPGTTPDPLAVHLTPKEEEHIARTIMCHGITNISTHLALEAFVAACGEALQAEELPAVLARVQLTERWAAIQAAVDQEGVDGDGGDRGGGRRMVGASPASSCVVGLGNTDLLLVMTAIKAIRVAQGQQAAAEGSVDRRVRLARIAAARQQQQRVAHQQQQQRKMPSAPLGVGFLLESFTMLLDQLTDEGGQSLSLSSPLRASNASRGGGGGGGSSGDHGNSVRDVFMSLSADGGQTVESAYVRQVACSFHLNIDVDAILSELGGGADASDDGSSSSRSSSDDAGDSSPGVRLLSKKRKHGQHQHASRPLTFDEFQYLLDVLEANEERALQQRAHSMHQQQQSFRAATNAANNKTGQKTLPSMGASQVAPQHCFGAEKRGATSRSSLEQSGIGPAFLEQHPLLPQDDDDEDEDPQEGPCAWGGGASYAKDEYTRLDMGGGGGVGNVDRGWYEGESRSTDWDHISGTTPHASLVLPGGGIATPVSLKSPATTSQRSFSEARGEMEMPDGGPMKPLALRLPSLYQLQQQQEQQPQNEAPHENLGRGTSKLLLPALPADSRSNNRKPENGTRTGVGRAVRGEQHGQPCSYAPSARVTLMGRLPPMQQRLTNTRLFGAAPAWAVKYDSYIHKRQPDAQL